MSDAELFPFKLLRKHQVSNYQTYYTVTSLSHNRDLEIWRLSHNRDLEICLIIKLTIQ